jgi:hypothetical protein
MGWGSAGFEIGNTLDKRAYPAARTKRTGPPASGASSAAQAAADQGLTPAQSYVFTFNMLATANNRSTVSSPKLRGPSIVRGLHLTKTGTPDGTQHLALGKSKFAITESNVPTTTVRPYTSLFTALPVTGGAAALVNDGTAMVDAANTILMDADNLGIIVLDLDWFLTVTAAAAAVGSDTIMGYVTVLDQVPDALLASYVG